MFGAGLAYLLSKAHHGVEVDCFYTRSHLFGIGRLEIHGGIMARSFLVVVSSGKWSHYRVMNNEADG
jgi:hypothetical protein